MAPVQLTPGPPRSAGPPAGGPVIPWEPCLAPVSDGPILEGPASGQRSPGATVEETMKYVFRTLVTTGVIAVLGLTVVMLLRTLHPTWWRRRAVRWAAWGLPVAAAVAGVAWMVGFRAGIEWLFKVGSTASAVAVVVLLGLVIALPVSGLLHLLHRGLERRARPDPARFDNERRDLLKLAAGAVPAVVVLTGGTGIARAFQNTRVYLRPLRFPDLPPALEGLRVLHLTDSHLGFFRNLPDFEAVTRAARPFEPDLVLLTGDIADDLEQLPGALERAASLKPRLGVYGTLGNHEYSRGIEAVMRAYAHSPVRLLRSDGVPLDVQGTRLWLAGADDPRYMHKDTAPFLERTVAEAMIGAPTDAFRLLLSHRPEGLLPAARHGIQLTLAGHTHGGQVGFGGRSFWRLFTRRYLWGEYRERAAQMYLSAGIGHWFPFRLGCPTEAPVIVLRRG